MRSRSARDHHCLRWVAASAVVVEVVVVEVVVVEVVVEVGSGGRSRLTGRLWCWVLSPLPLPAFPSAYLSPCGPCWRPDAGHLGAVTHGTLSPRPLPATPFTPAPSCGPRWEHAPLQLAYPLPLPLRARRHHSRPQPRNAVDVQR